MPKTTLMIATPDGEAQAALFHPTTGAAKAGVLFFMDAFGPRPALDGMAQRLADLGYAVLLPDLLYRDAPYGPFDPKTAFSQDETRKALMALLGKTTQAMTQSDTGAFIDALRVQGVAGPLGIVGYCMGGTRALTAAAAWPNAIAAAASFHGGRLGADAPDSPAALAGQIKARVYVGGAGVDQSFPPEQSATLAQALRLAGVDHIIENYAGAEHGWCVTDSAAYNEPLAERHWNRLATVFGEALGGAT